MPRFFFNIHHDEVFLDRTGTELPDRDAAWEEATIAAAEAIKGLGGKLQPDHDWRMEVVDESANVLWELQVVARRK